MNTSDVTLQELNKMSENQNVINWVAQSDYKAAVTAMQMKLKERIEVLQQQEIENIHNKRKQPQQQQRLEDHKNDDVTTTHHDSHNLIVSLLKNERLFITECNKHLQQVLEQIVHPVPDEVFHKYIYNCYHGTEPLDDTTKGDNGKDNENIDSDPDDNEDDDEFMFEEDDLIDTNAFHQVKQYREQVRQQANINEKKRQEYIESITQIIQKEMNIYQLKHQINQEEWYDDDPKSNHDASESTMSTYSSSYGADHDNQNEIEDKSITIQQQQQQQTLLEEKNELYAKYYLVLNELQSKLKSVKYHIESCSETMILNQWDRISQTMKEVERTFIIQQQTDTNDNEFTLLTQPLTQVEEAIVAREDDDDYENVCDENQYPYDGSIILNHSQKEKPNILFQRIENSKHYQGKEANKLTSSLFEENQSPNRIFLRHCASFNNE